MNRWYASVNYGLEKTISEIIKTHSAYDVTTVNSALIFSCKNEINLKCINNLFVIISSFHSKNIVEAANNISRLNFRTPRFIGQSFRLIVMDCGKLCAIPQKVMIEVEKNISRQTKLITHRANPDIEIWLNRRNDGSTYFMIRVNKHSSFEKTLKQGELRPDIVDVMLYKSKIDRQSVIADLFGGWGSIAAAIIESGRYKKIYTGDIDDKCVQYQKTRLHNKQNCIVQKWDACVLPLENISIDAVITDPPWGEYEKYNIPQFYDAFIRETARVLRPKGTFVFLSSKKNEAIQSLEKCGFSFYHITLKVNGKDTFLFCAEH